MTTAADRDARRAVWMILRLGAVTRSGAVGVCTAVLAAADRGAAMIEPARVLRVPMFAVRPMLVLVPVSTGRRGPPFVRAS